MFSCWFDSQSLAIVVPSKSLLSCSSKLVRQYKFFWPSLILNRTFFTDGEDVGCPEYRSWINLEEVLSKLGLGWSWLVWADLALWEWALSNFLWMISAWQGRFQSSVCARYSLLLLMTIWNWKWKWWRRSKEWLARAAESAFSASKSRLSASALKRTRWFLQIHVQCTLCPLK